MPSLIAPPLPKLLLREQRHNGMPYVKIINGTTIQEAIQSTVQMEVYQNKTKQHIGDKSNDNEL